MAKTKSLNSDNSVYVTTYAGGKKRGRCYTFTVNTPTGLRVKLDLTEVEFGRLLAKNENTVVSADNGVRPDFDL